MIRHPSGYLCDPQAGVVYGLRGKPIRKIASRGYVCAWDGNAVRLAHRLIWEAINGPIPHGMQINHINGIKTDNRIVNLEVVTPAGNSQHAYATGLSSAKGERNGRAKLTKEAVLAIRASECSVADLAARYEVSVRAIRDVRNGTRWAHVPMGRNA